MALTAAQRRKLPPSAFVYPSTRKYPVPTKAQARKAGISEKTRLATHRAAKSYVARKSTSGTPAKVNAIVHKRGPLKPKGRRK
jgi:hypothetical protein